MLRRCRQERAKESRMKRPWMPLYIADYLKDTTHLGALESGAYLHLIMDYWQNGKLPYDDRQLARIAKLTEREWKRLRPILQAFFHDGWRHKRIDDELAHATKVSETRSAIATARQAAIREKHESKRSAIASPIADTLHTSQEERKEDAASAALPEAELFRRGKEILGKTSGGVIKNLLKAKQNNVPLARAAIEQASTKADPREYIGAIIRGREENSALRPGFGDDWG
jgi:uncharacterized protein YdaU (DUF1376 family)